MDRIISERDRAFITRVVAFLCVLALVATPFASAAAAPRGEEKLDVPFVSGREPTRARAWSSSARARVKPKPCRHDPVWLCGSVRVPLDRANRSGRKLDIAFELLPHRNPRAGRRAPVVVTAGGPGASTTDGRGFWGFVLSGMNRTRDLLLIDPRGTGKSGALRCLRLQRGWNSIAELESDVAACGRKLGDAADRYGSGDIALDVDAVRRALGYRRINYVTSSYGTVHEQAYATRFPEHLRAVVADSGLLVTDPAHAAQWGFGFPDALVRAVAVSCDRAPGCAAAHPDAGERFADLVRRVADEPITGTGYDAHGKPHDVVVDEPQLAAIVVAHTLNPGEIAAAAVALENGAPAPLLRLAAESPLWVGHQGDPRSFSMGANAATYCNDQDSVWQRDQSFQQRAEEYEEALEDLPGGTFAPFSVDGWVGQWWPTTCIRWPAPDRFKPAVPQSATVPDVPVLVLTGDLDTTVASEMTEQLTDVYPNATVVNVAGAGHDSIAWGDCPNRIATRFIATLDPGDRSCAEEPSFVGAAVPEYPRTAAGATPAAPVADAGDESTTRDRRVLTAVTRTVLDAWLRSFRQPEVVATGRGLRGGTFDADYRSGTKATIDLHRARWVKDVAVRGRSTWAYATNLIKSKVTIWGAGTALGRLRLRGRWGFGAPFGKFTLRGAIGGRRITVRVPAH